MSTRKKRISAFMVRPFLALVLLLCLSSLASAEPPPSPLSVGVYGSPPFVVIRADGTITGLSMDVWTETAKRLGLEYRTVRVDAAQDVISGLEARKLDVGIGPISMTSRRVERVSFTQPYFHSNLAIMSPMQPVEQSRHVRPLMRLSIVLSIEMAVLVLLLLLLVRLTAKGARRQTIAGMLETVRSALGHGDPFAETPGARLLAAVITLAAVMIVSALTAAVTSTSLALTGETGSVKSAAELNGRRVAVIAGGTGEAYVRSMNAQTVPVASYEEAISVLLKGQVDATVGDHLVLDYYLQEHPEVRVSLTPASFDLQNYAFALRPGDPLIRRLNVVLLSLAESEALDRISSSWLSPKNPHPGAP